MDTAGGPSSSGSTNQQFNYEETMEINDMTLEQLIETVQRLEEGLEALAEILEENHQETLEKLSDLAEGGRGYTVSRFDE